MHPMHVRYQAALRPEGADYNRAIARTAPILLMMMGSVIFFTVSSCQPNTGVSTFRLVYNQVKTGPIIATQTVNMPNVKLTVMILRILPSMSAASFQRCLATCRLKGT